MGEIGEILKNAREKKGITIQQAEEDTKIRAKYLIALEDENYDHIPGKVYVKGFLNNYASYLGLDSQELIATLKQSLPEESVIKPLNHTSQAMNKKKYRKRYRFKPKYLRYLAGFAALVLLWAFAQWYPTWIHGNTAVETKNNTKVAEKQPTNKKADTKSANNKNKQQENPSTAQGNQQQPAVQPDQSQQTQQNQSGTHLVLNADKGVSWVSVTVDGVNVFSGNINQGETKNFDGKDKIAIRLGNAGAVNVTFNGKNYGYLGGMGNVVDKQFTVNTQ